MTANTLMVMGTASSVGKSVLVTALCRILKQDGFQVAPFKSQNMSLNSCATVEDGEIGRAQAVQAMAAGLAPSVDFNPVLLKPQADGCSQLVVSGKVSRTISAADYYRYTPELVSVVQVALARLRAAYDVVVIEGAGSPAEINLKDREIVNMRVAKMAGAPVLLAGDIDRGGVFAALVGTLALLDPDERDYVKGLVINKFRGDPGLLKPGLVKLEQLTAKPVLGVVPYYRDIRLPQEDSVYLDERPDGAAGGAPDIAVVRLPHIANYDDFDPLEEDGIAVRYLSRARELGRPHLIILPGTKSTVSDLAYLKRSGLAREVVRLAGEGVPVIGICGGYQMLGRRILDPLGIESAAPSVPGLGLLEVETTFEPQKATRQVTATISAGYGLLEGMRGQAITGYEIHMGKTTANGQAAAFRITGTPPGTADYDDGAIDGCGMVLGTYLHGLFANDRFRKNLLDGLRHRNGLAAGNGVTPLGQEAHFDRLAALVRASLDMERLYQIIEGGING
ncbi:MAG: cobyric acid synthase [Dehalococcoidia bacterium]|nr:MAG: cobyric acid synthase [Dehalococcoidia bacterium]